MPFELLTLSVPKWAQDSMRDIGVQIPSAAPVQIPAFDEAEAPVVMEVEFTGLGGWRPDSELPIRKVGSRLYAHYPTTGPYEPFTSTGGPGLSLVPDTLANWLESATMFVDKPFLPVPLEQNHGRTSFETVQFLRGPKIEQRMAEYAANTTAFIGGVFHVVVHEPAWRLFRLDDGQAAARICVPIEESYLAQTTVRLDHRDEVAAFFPKTLGRRRGEHPVTYFGDVRIVAPEGFAFTRNDVRLTALDTAQTLLATTSDLAPWQASPVLAARNQLACLLHTGAWTPSEMFAACDSFGTVLAEEPRTEREAHRAHRLSLLRRQVWTDLRRHVAA